MRLMKPCIECGVPSQETRCEPCKGYPAAWKRVSAKARKLQPFCLDCGATEQLSTDHSPEAWMRHALRLSIRLRDVAVLCSDCNTARGSSRPGSARYEQWLGTPAAQRYSRRLKAVS